LTKADISPADVLREALARSPLPAVLTDSDDRVVFANQRACSVLGLVAGRGGWERAAVEETERRALDIRLDESVASDKDGWHLLGTTENAGPGADFGPGKVYASLGTEKRGGGPDSPLTRREREILSLVATGLRTDEIAGRLTVSPETVKSHVHNAMTKLRAHTRSQAVAIALTTGQVTYTGEDLASVSNS
jgi:DNA-binding CsgD family transcriptional regulator